MNTRETIENHRYKLADSGSRAVIHNDIEGLDVEIDIAAEEFAGMLTASDDRPCAQDRALDAPLRLGYTGGTTGKAKAVTLTTRGPSLPSSATTPAGSVCTANAPCQTTERPKTGAPTSVVRTVEGGSPHRRHNTQVGFHRANLLAGRCAIYRPLSRVIEGECGSE